MDLRLLAQEGLNEKRKKLKPVKLTRKTNKAENQTNGEHHFCKFYQMISFFYKKVKNGTI